MDSASEWIDFASEWSDRAACRGMPLDMFFDSERWSGALATCARCPVRDECRTWNDRQEAALAFGALAGVFGGETPRQRTRRRRDQRGRRRAA